MTEELQRMKELSAVLEDDKGIIKGVNDGYGDYSQEVQQSKKLVQKMQRQHQKDKIMLGLGMAFFCSVCLYIIHKRIPIVVLLDGWWILSWTFLMVQVKWSRNCRNGNMSDPR